MIIDELFEAPQQCPECGGISFSDLILAEKKDACYYKVKASAKVWPSAYASGRLVQCRKKGAANYGNKSEGVAEGSRDRRDPYDRGYHDGQRMGSNSYHNPYSREDEPTEWDEYKSGFNMAQIELQNDLEDNNFSEGVAEGKIQYGVLDNDNVNLIIDKSESKPDGIYSFRGILFKVKGGKVTHYATNGKILQAMGRFNTQIGSYDSSSQAKSILKGIEQGVAEGAQEDAKFTPRLQIRSQIETALDQYLDPEKVAGAHTDIQYYKHDGKVYVEVLFNYTNGQKIGPKQRKQFLVNKDFTLTPIKKQGMAEAGDSNFVGFMNKTLADKVDSPKADPIAGAPDFYRNAAVSTLDGRQGFKNALKFGLKALSRLDPETRQQLAAGSEQAVANYLTDVAERSGQMGDDTFVEEDITEVQDYLGDVFHDPSINSWKDVLQQSQGMSDGQLDEKSVSQAQFRTMAAAAHNPKFAKKVGIKQSVAKEFNQADKGSNYKKLPDRTNEGGDVFMANIKDTPEYKAGFATGKLPVPHPEGTQQYASYYKGVIDKASPTLNKVGEGEQQKGADYRDPPEADYGDDYQDMVARVKKLAGLGPLKTVYDPAKRVYRNMPAAVQPKK
jgi:hypothetical protein